MPAAKLISIIHGGRKLKPPASVRLPPCTEKQRLRRARTYLYRLHKLTPKQKRRMEKTNLPILRSSVHDYSYAELYRVNTRSVAKYMHAEIEALPPQAFENPDRLIMQIRPTWHALLADFFHLYDPINSAARCSSSCLLKKTTLCVCERIQLYGCWAHGYLHRCTGDDCYVIHMSRGAGMNCVISGKFIGYKQDTGESSYRNCGDRKQKFDYYRSRIAHQSIANTCENRAHVEDAKLAATSAEDPKEELSPELQSLLSEYEDSHQALCTATDAIPAPSVKRPVAPQNDPDQYSLLASATKIMRPIELKEQEEKHNAAVQRTALIRKSSAAVGLAEQALELGNDMMRTTVYRVIEDILFGSDNRALYNTFMHQTAVVAARADVDELYVEARKKGAIVLVPDVLLILESYNRDCVPLVVNVDREQANIEQIVSNILFMWKRCNESPFVKERTVVDERTNLTRTLPTETDMCSLRQFTLAALYHMKEGLSIHVPGSFELDRFLIFAPETRMALDLPPEEHVRYFGNEARIELQRLVDIGAYAEREFDLNRENLTAVVKTKNAKSFAMTVSSSIERALQGGDTIDKKRRSKSRRAYDETTNTMERSAGFTHGRIVIHSTDAGGASTTLTEHQCMPAYMREPMLSGGNSKTRTNVYDTLDLLKGRQFISRALHSYSHRVVHVFDE